MRSIAVNSKNDIYRGSTGNLAMVTDLDAVSQDAEHAMKTQFQEVTLDLTVGVKTKATIWDKYQPQAFAASGRKNIALVPNVTSVTSFTVARLNGVASYVAKIASTYGPLTIAGNLNQ